MKYFLIDRAETLAARLVLPVEMQESAGFLRIVDGDFRESFTPWFVAVKDIDIQRGQLRPEELSDLFLCALLWKVTHEDFHNE